MMKKLLILVNELSENKINLTDLLRTSLKPTVEVSLKLFSEVMIGFEGKKLLIKVNNEDIKNYDLVYFRRVGRGFFALAGSLALGLDYLKIEYFDSTFSQIGPAGSKFTSLLKLTLADLPVMPSFFCWRDKIKKNINNLVKKYGLPLIAKETSSERGEGIFLIKTEKDFRFLQETDKKDQFLFQKFYPAKEEYRILVYGYQAALFYRKIKTDPKEFRANMATGGGFEFFPVEKAPLEMREAAIRTAKILKLEITGVDFLVDQNDKFWILEANRGPGFTYDVKLSPEVPELAAFFARELGVKK